MKQECKRQTHTHTHRFYRLPVWQIIYFIGIYCSRYYYICTKFDASAAAQWQKYNRQNRTSRVWISINNNCATSNVVLCHYPKNYIDELLIIIVMLPHCLNKYMKFHPKFKLNERSLVKCEWVKIPMCCTNNNKKHRNANEKRKWHANFAGDGIIWLCCFMHNSNSYMRISKINSISLDVARVDRLSIHFDVVLQLLLLQMWARGWVNIVWVCVLIQIITFA